MHCLISNSTYSLDFQLPVKPLPKSVIERSFFPPTPCNVWSSPRLHSSISDLTSTVILVFSLAYRIVLYADDILLYKSILGPQDMTSFQNNVNLFNNRDADNHLAVNPLKTRFMFISHSHSFNFLPLLLNGSKLEKVSHFKYLGVWISDDLSWAKHIESVCSKSRRTLSCIFRTLSPYCDPLYIHKSQVMLNWHFCYPHFWITVTIVTFHL